LGLLIVGSLGALAGCSSDEDKCLPGDPACGAAGTAPVTGQGGTGPVAGVGGSSSGGTAGNSAGGTGGAGGGGANLNRGEAAQLLDATATPTSLPFTIADAAYGIQGSSFLDRSAQGNTFEVVPGAPGELCVRGNLETVPAATNYSTHWGVDFGFNLNQATTPVGGGDADAGADAGTPAAGALPPLAWLPPAGVIGFSFVVTGPTINLIRFRVRPFGLDPTLEASIYCKTIPAAVSGQPTDVLFSEVTQQCWNPGTPQAPTAAGFDRISWNLPADVGVPPRPFDFCIKDIKPILAP
jgi:hypothetical protein